MQRCKPVKLILYRDTFAITEIDFVPGPFPCQIVLAHLKYVRLVKPTRSHTHAIIAVVMICLMLLSSSGLRR